MDKEPKYMYNGSPVPRVTEIINKMIHEDYIVIWANKLGYQHKSYQTELKRYADIGTVTHKRIEEILKGAPLNYYESAPVRAFCKWYDIIRIQPEFKLIYSEKELVSRDYGGTLDALMLINGMRILVDFKTSNHITYKYFLQLAAYRKLLREQDGMVIDAAIILQLDKQQPEFEEYILFMNEFGSLMNYYEQAFNTLVSGYNAINKCESLYNEYITVRETLQDAKFSN